jgi:hypothetical protein
LEINRRNRKKRKIIDLKSNLFSFEYKAKKKNKFLIPRHLLSDHNGNANKRNRLNQTSLHCLLQPGNEVRRNECLTLLLKWKEKHTSETIDIDAKDSVIQLFDLFQ